MSVKAEKIDVLTIICAAAHRLSRIDGPELAEPLNDALGVIAALLAADRAFDHALASLEQGGPFVHEVMRTARAQRTYALARIGNDR